MNKIPLFSLMLASVSFLVGSLDAEIVKILIQGDTQKIMDSKNGKQDNFVPFMAKLLTDPVTKDADFILQMGDIVESDKDNSDRPQQYRIARKGWQQLDGKIPYVLNLGNNDDFEEYLEAFDNLPEPFWSNADGKNFAYNFDAGGISWLVISLRFESSDEENKAVEDLIKKYPEKKVILIKHEINFDGGLVNNRLKKYPNVSFILSGHTQSGKTLLTGDNGNKIGWIRTCHHNANRDSYFRVLIIETVEGTVSSSFYSPQYEKFWHDLEAPYRDPIKSAPWIWHGFNFVSGTSNELNNAQFISLQMPFSVTPGQQFEAHVTYKNTGTSAWPANSQYKLGSQNLRDNQNWGAGTNRTKLSVDVGPGEEYTFTVSCTAPTIEGNYNFQRQMLQENVQWFGDFSENRIVGVSHNVVSDHSFEDGGGSWQIISFEKYLSTENRRSGDFSLKLKGENSAVTATQNIILKSHTDYNISFWVINRNVDSGNIVFEFNEAFDIVSDDLFVIGPKDANNWKQYKGHFNSGESTAATIRIFSPELKGVAYFDDIVVTPFFNEAPKIKSSPRQVVYENTLYSYSLNATDPDSDMLIYRALDIPKWLTFNSALGILSGTAPSYDGINSYPVTVSVSDGKREVKQFFYISVVADKPYDVWTRLYNVTEIGKDTDNDGFPDLLEFALGGDPNDGELPSELLMQALGEHGFDLTFRRNQRTLNYTIQKSEDLKNWHDHLTLDDSHGAVGDICTVSVPVLEDKHFFRLRVSM